MKENRRTWKKVNEHERTWKKTKENEITSTTKRKRMDNDIKWKKIKDD